ncbi:sensor histidine kinase [Nonomuraea sp. H19]|uniref:sensor histidine kinase n=1 Tax=Nonomuraea sp. H19 TaxID=3452206 RepID=UPI003F89CAAB
MSAPLLPPTAPERQDAGSRGRPRGRGKRRPTNVHAFHLGISILPAGLMACLGLIAVTVLIVAEPSSRQAWPTLAVIAGGAVAIMCVAVVAADKATQRERQISGRSASRLNDLEPRLGDLGFSVSRSRQELHGLAERIAAGDVPARRGVDFRPVATGDPIAHLAQEFQKAQNEAWNAVINAASRKPSGRPAQRVEVFVNLALRMQSLSHRAMRGLDELENQVEDPELLKGLFRVDHLTTRLRRQAESLAVIGGAVSRRQWSRPVTTYEVLRSAIAEVEHYSRVKVMPPVEGALDGSAAADVIHLLAELVENATKFSPPHTQVLLRAEAVTAGLAIEIEDRGLGIPRETQRRLNDLLTAPERIDVDELVQDGRIGLLVVSALSHRHKVVVRLQTNLYGGTQAIVVIPNELIGSETQETGARQATSPEPAGPTPALSASTPGSLFSPMPSSGSRKNTPVRSRHDAGARPDGPSEAWRKQSAGTPARQAEERNDLGPPRGAGRRPELPKRRPQANMAAELLNAPAPLDDDTDPGLDHGLMASFMKGMRSGQDEDR